MDAETVLKLTGASASKHAVLGFASGAVRVSRESIARADPGELANRDLLAAKLVHDYGSTDPTTTILFDAAAVSYVKL